MGKFKREKGAGAAGRWREGSCGHEGAVMGWTGKLDADEKELFPSLQYPIHQFQLVCPWLSMAHVVLCLCSV